ncbi:SOS response-associated peptidase [Enterococcus massiliensis]|uniref:SOS response-associated peptidase n=1 Tax=Enterococcus massiliensis TaxID=1640685 RepID=UPI00065E5CC1|nr:SOS response-associated peptidase family protein [Enterococcus massiliensis]
MCGRYFFDKHSEKLKAYWDSAMKRRKKDVEVSLAEIYPSNHVVTLGANKQGEVVAGITRWGFEGFRKGQLLINARSETVEEKKTFAKHFRENRCVFPMSGFYEWKEKEKFFFSKGETLYVAGFYRIHKKEAGFETESIILTTEANASVEQIHDRMPLVIEEEQINQWITDIDFAREIISQSMPLLEVKLIEDKKENSRK